MSTNRRGNVANAIFGAADYLAQPVILVLATPFLVSQLGVQQYGTWMLVTAVSGGMGALSAGFGDATVKYVSAYRSLGNTAQVQNTISASITINSVLGGLFGAIVWLGAPFAVRALLQIEPELHQSSIVALRVASAILFARSVEGVFVSILRAYEAYGPSVKINVLGRLSTVAAAVLCARFQFGVVGIMYASLAICLASVALQALAVRRYLGRFTLFPGFHRATLTEMAGFGGFSWLQAVAGVFFMHGDRLVVGSMLGTSAVAYYSICVQAAQPIHGLLASALNFLFPSLSSRYESRNIQETMRLYSKAIWVSFAAAAVCTVPLALFSKLILTLWLGSDVARHAHLALSILAVAYGILAINVVPYYGLLAAGQVRFVSIVNILGGLLSLAASVALIPAFGLVGAALGRLLYGPTVSLSFLKARACLQERARPTWALE